MKFNGMAAAQAAIAALHNQRSLPPLRNPLQVALASCPHSPRCVRAAGCGICSASSTIIVVEPWPVRYWGRAASLKPSLL